MRNFLSEEFLGWKISWGKFEICTVDILLCASFSHRGIAPMGCCWWWQPPLLSFANSQNFTFIGNQWWGFLGAICSFIGWTFFLLGEHFFYGWTFFFSGEHFLLLGEHLSHLLLFLGSSLFIGNQWGLGPICSFSSSAFRNKICCKELHTHPLQDMILKFWIMSIKSINYA